jgi:hypothetical protein
MSDNDNHPTMQLDIAGVPITIRGKPADEGQAVARERIEHEARTMRYGVVAMGIAVAALVVVAVLIVAG